MHIPTQTRQCTQAHKQGVHFVDVADGAADAEIAVAAVVAVAAAAVLAAVAAVAAVEAAAVVAAVVAAVEVEVAAVCVHPWRTAAGYYELAVGPADTAAAASAWVAVSVARSVPLPACSAFAFVHSWSIFGPVTQMLRLRRGGPWRW